MMNTREFLNSVIALAADNAEIVEKANAMLVALDNKNSKRADAEKAKRAETDAPLFVALNDYLACHELVIASEIATALGVSTSKASALLRKLVANGTATVCDVKVKGKGTVKGYTLAH